MSEVPVYKSEYLHIKYIPEEQLIICTWKPDMITLPVEEFKQEILHFLTPLEKYKVKRYLINSIDASYPLTESLINWIFNKVFSVVEKYGVEKLAIVYPIDYPTRLALEKIFSDAVENISSLKITGWDDIEGARRWLIE